MAEALSPKAKQRAPFSPTSPFFLASNNDKLERAQARAARDAAVRRKLDAPTSTAFEEDPCLGKEQILQLLHNCIKLASENKINQKNTWELNLIDHLGEIIKVEEENDTETNFQKASCTLEAGVKIYSLRVDSVHSEAYKVLGGINRVGQENEQGPILEDADISNEQEENDKKEQGRKLSPLSTLEPSFNAINVKKFDVAFVVDPLYHQTSAQFDEGGAKGLLLNNLGVYADCRVLFDSLEVPGKCMSTLSQSEGGEKIDLSFARECIEQMVLNMSNDMEISPSLGAMLNQFDTDQRISYDLNSSEQVIGRSNNNPDMDGDSFGNGYSFSNSENMGFGHDDHTTTVDEGTYDQDPIFPTQPDVSDSGDDGVKFHDLLEDDRFGEVDGYLFSSLGFSTKQNAWAGPNHWKYQKVKDCCIDPKDQAEENGSPKAKKMKNKKAETDLDFSRAIDADISNIFDPPKNPKSLLLPANRAPCNTKLPEDCHYQPEDLVKLFLLPNVLCLGKGGRRRKDEETQHGDDFGAAKFRDDDGSGFDGAFDDGHFNSDVEESSTLISQPRQVNKIEVQYDKTSKQVDVHVLKETLWDHIQKLNQTSVQEESPEGTISFRQVLSCFPDSCRAAASINDISPHLCFICLLHLANEHGMQINGCPSLDDLSINIRPHVDTLS
ncbi:condensin complex subunit 2-like isoform X1 [Primulina eburnea]|uniref:condensin complex subunit 2-like isoform X1 n=1 Tax=Primulina eburnea TaxID=1245227 RepID=UPI003C6CAE1E